MCCVFNVCTKLQLNTWGLINHKSKACWRYIARSAPCQTRAISSEVHWQFRRVPREWHVFLALHRHVGREQQGQSGWWSRDGGRWVFASAASLHSSHWELGWFDSLQCLFSVYRGSSWMIIISTAAVYTCTVYTGRIILDELFFPINLNQV